MLEQISISGFKSIKSLSNFELKPINIMIGANGAGKSNFIDFFRMLRAMQEFSIAELKDNPSLSAFIEDKGGMANLLFNGPRTQKISTELFFNNGQNGYRFDLDITSAAGFMINNEACFYKGAPNGQSWKILGGGYARPRLLDERTHPKKNTNKNNKNNDKPNQKQNRYDYIYETIKTWQIYHFHDTSRLSGVRMPCDISDNRSFRFDASNLAAFLYALKEGDYGAAETASELNDGTVRHQLEPNRTAQDSYEKIVESVKVIAPYFEDFILVPPKAGKDNLIKLQWKQKGSDINMQAYHLSDGTLRFICLATALLQPDPPGLLLIDEPELGLHPEALTVLAELINLSKEHTQILASTQSPAFADLFQPEDIITVKRQDGATVFERLDANALAAWINHFSIGQLWRKNVIKGGIVNE